MDIRKYFWEFNDKAINETIKILKNPSHPKFIQRFFILLSRCDDPKVIFSIISKDEFIKAWPRVRRYWRNIGEKTDFFAWWETIYEGVLEEVSKKKITPQVMSCVLSDIGKKIKFARIEKNLSQEELAKRCGLAQSDISLIERGLKNITVLRLARIFKVLGLDKIEIVLRK